MANKKEKSRIFEQAEKNHRVETDNVRMLSKFIEIQTGKHLAVGSHKPPGPVSPVGENHSLHLKAKIDATDELNKENSRLLARIQKTDPMEPKIKDLESSWYKKKYLVAMHSNKKIPIQVSQDRQKIIQKQSGSRSPSQEFDKKQIQDAAAKRKPMQVNTGAELGEVTFSGTANTFQRESESKSGETGGNGNSFAIGSQSVTHLEHQREAADKIVGDSGANFADSNNLNQETAMQLKEELDEVDSI